MGEGRVALVTGGGTGLGRATAKALAEAGFAVAIAGRRADVCETSASQLRDEVAGATVSAYQADVADPNAVEQLVAAVIKDLGGLDVLVAAAGVYENVSYLDMTADLWDRTMNVVLRGAMLCSVAAARHMRDHGGGRIVLISSVSGAMAEPDSAHYNAAKAGIISLARSMAVDISRFGITANAVIPGWMRTPMTEDYIAQASTEDLRRFNVLGRPADPSEVAGFIRYLATDASPYLTGAALVIDGGHTAALAMP